MLRELVAEVDSEPALVRDVVLESLLVRELLCADDVSDPVLLCPVLLVDVTSELVPVLELV